jgi:cathepsin L
MLACLLPLSLSRLVLPHEEKSFLSHLRLHGLIYTGAEYHLRLGVFLSQRRHIRAFNSGGHTFVLGLTRLATLTPSEYRAFVGRSRSAWPSRSLVSHPAYPASWDWRGHGVVQAVKDQGSCSAAYAFSSVAAQESRWAIARGVLFSLSEQNIVDCDSKASGCDGGAPDGAFDYVLFYQNGEFATEADYPWTAAAGTCVWDQSRGVAPLRGRASADPNEDALADAVWTGPVVCTVDAAHSSFQLYSGGIYDEPACSSTELNHPVAAVGWGTDCEVPCWIVRNSWGTQWGESGYIRMVRNKNNQCGIASLVLFPLI